MNEHYEKWDELAPRGLVLIGLGMSITGDAIATKARGKGFLKWFIKGVIGLVVLNTGIAIFGESVKQRVLYELDVRQMQDPS
jgi:hypothetical protein